MTRTELLIIAAAVVTWLTWKHFKKSAPRRRVNQFIDLLQTQHSQRINWTSVRNSEVTQEQLRQLQRRERYLQARVDAFKARILQDDRHLEHLGDSLRYYTAPSSKILLAMKEWGVKALPYILQAADFTRYSAESQDMPAENKQEALDFLSRCLRAVGQINGSIPYLFECAVSHHYVREKQRLSKTATFCDTVLIDDQIKEVIEALALCGSASIPYFCFRWHSLYESYKESPSGRFLLQYLRKICDSVLTKSIELKTDTFDDAHRVLLDYRRPIIGILGDDTFLEIVDMLEPSVSRRIRRRWEHDNDFVR